MVHFALSDQDCASGFVMGIGTDGTLLCADDADTTYTADYGLNLDGQAFSVNVKEVVTRQYGGLIWPGNEARGYFGTEGYGPAITITAVNRVTEVMYTYRCIKTNLVAVMCMDLVSGASSEFVTFSPTEHVMFSESHHDLLVYLDGSSPYNAEVILRMTDSANTPFEIQGGL